MSRNSIETENSCSKESKSKHDEDEYWYNGMRIDELMSPKDRILLRDSTLTAQEYYSVKAYTVHSFSIIQYLLNGRNPRRLDEVANDFISALDKLNNVCGINKPLYAGIDFSVRPTWLSIMPRSTSLYAYSSFIHCSNITLIFLNPRNVANINPMSQYTGQYEYVLLPNQCYKAVDISIMSCSYSKRIVFYMKTVDRSECDDEDGDIINMRNNVSGYFESLVSSKKLLNIIYPKAENKGILKYLLGAVGLKVKSSEAEKFTTDTDKFGNNILHYAMMHSTVSDIRYYIKKIDINSQNNLGLTPLTKYLNSVIFQISLINTKRPGIRQLDNLLESALDMINLIHPNDIDVNIRDYLGNTLLMMLAGVNAIIDELEFTDLRTVNAINRYGESVLRYCISGEYIDYIDKLGFIPRKNALDDYFTAIHPINRFHPVLEESMRWVKRGLIDINTVDEHGNTYLMKCVHEDEIKLLIDNGIDVGTKNKKGENAMFFVKSIRMLELLHSNGVPADVENIDGQTPVMMLIINNYFDPLILGMMMRMIELGSVIKEDVMGSKGSEYVYGEYYDL